ncbi:MAG: N-acetylglucosamine-6-phosphate deacetylase [Ruminococcaceae bacterium]|nr:N-acetylglucosamine-6-phosphate deacetylase [Oscillospiraceae bacterium]
MRQYVIIKKDTVKEVIEVKTLFRGGKVLQPNGSFSDRLAVLIDGDTITAVHDSDQAPAADRVCDLQGKLLLPGLVDVHTHGRAGFDFQDATVDQLNTMKADYARHGVTTVFPTLASASVSDWIEAIARIDACGFDGIHLEGRYLNPTKRGAHPAHLLAPLNAEELDTVLQKITSPCHVSAALELDTDGSFSACARRHGATLGLAHTMATATETRTAMERGATSFTHLFNAMPPLHHREGGAVSVALCGGGYGELIADGLHVCPDMIALAYRCLGRDRTVLVTDSMQGTGCPDGEYSIAGQPVILKNGRAMTLDGVLAGSTLNLWEGVQNLMRFANVPLGEAVLCATRNPAEMVGISNRVGMIEQGKRADLLIVDPRDNQIETVIFHGKPLTEPKGAT